MTPRTRRFLASAVATIALLYTGRWIADFLATRWWAAAISPAAEAAVTRWQLLGLALDAGAVVIASCWFAANGLLVARAIGSVQVQRHVGNELVRESVPTRWLVAGAIALGVLLGLLTGAGAAAWRAPLLLALNAPTFGIDDTLLGVDLGVLVARYPLWRAAHGFLVSLALLGCAFVLMLYAAIGAFRRQDQRVELHPDARRHIGGLLAFLALLVAAGFLLTPYRIATSIDVPLGHAAASTRVLAAYAAAGAAIAAAVLSVLWLLRGRLSLLIGGWAALALVAMSELLVVPAFVAEAGSAVERATLQRQMDSVFHGIALTKGNPATDTLPRTTALWDDRYLQRWSRERGEHLLGVAAQGSRDAPRLLVATATDSAREIRLNSLAPGELDAQGRPAPGDAATSGIPSPRSVPGQVGWTITDTGIRVGRALRPLVMAWSLQAPGILGIPGNSTIDWLRDPGDRVEALVPPLQWYPMGFAHVEGRLGWIMAGMATVDRAPMATRIMVDGRTVSGVEPSMIAVVTAETGAVRFFPDPSAGPLGMAWQQAFRGLISPLHELPGSVIGGLEYPRAWLDLQLSVLSQRHWDLGVQTPGVAVAAVWTPSPGAWQVSLDEPEHRRSVRLLTGSRVEGRAVIFDNRFPLGTPSAQQLIEAWQEMPPVVQLRDSLRAAGDTVMAGPVRWHLGAGGVWAWQPLMSGGRSGPSTLLWLGTASPLRFGGGRRPESAWASVMGDSTGADSGQSTEEPARLEAIRTWIARADSALARGDLTAFARAWEALRGMLLDAGPR